VFLQGFLRKTVCRTWFFDGENVVDVCLNVVLKRTESWRKKIRQLFEIIFALIQIAATRPVEARGLKIIISNNTIL
jgi:hypothetical protein